MKSQPKHGKRGEPLMIHFYTADGELIDAEQITLGSDNRPFQAAVSAPKGGKLTIEENDSLLIVKGGHFEIPFSKATGLIRNATSHGKVIIEEGPFLHLDINLNHLTGAEVRTSARNYKTAEADWQKQNLTYTRHEGAVEVIIAGTLQACAA